MKRVIGIGIVAAGWLACTGCSSAWWNSFLDPTQVGGEYRETMLVDIQETLTFHDKPSGIPHATDPTPEDLVAMVEEYRIGPGDVVQLRILDFQAQRTESEFMLTVNELGYIDIPQLGLIHVEGLSEQDVRGEVVQRAKAQGVYGPNYEPTVMVTLQLQQGRSFNISGAIAAPGTYRIIRPDFRLKEAINNAGSLGEQIKFIYVFRDGPRETRVEEHAAPMPAVEPGAEDTLPAPPVTPSGPMAVMGGPVAPMSESGAAPEPASRPSRNGGLALPAEEVERYLIDAIAPPGTTAPAETAPEAATLPAEAEPTSDLGSWIFVNDKFIGAPTQDTAPTSPEIEPTTSRPVDWSELAAEGRQRIIRIPAGQLRNGDASYNIVIRHRDWIRVDPGPIGVFYMGGHVMRPGTYQLSGEDMTLTAAVAASGGLDPLAWPSRCEVRRRIDRDREQITQWDLARIMEGKDPNHLVKPNDEIYIGTHAIAPFLATIRNSFRMTYGFGFVYDRNFADIDSFFGQTNPQDRRRNQRAFRFGL